MGTDNLDRLTYGGPCRDDLIDNDDASLQWGTHDIAPLTVLLFLLAVKSKGNGALFCLWALAQGNRCCSNQWYALVRRTIKHIKIHPCSNQGLSIKISQTMDAGTRIKQTGIKKIRA